MAQYKVPQDVEADDKLIGPFTFRQFIYLIIISLSLALAWALAQVSLPLALLPLPIIVFFGALALPLRKDQPMEVYMAALVSFYLKPHRRLWEPDGIDSLIEITAPKTIDIQRTKDISQNEAERRFRYLAEIVDSRGWAVRGVGVQAPNSAMNSDVYFEAQQIQDVLDDDNSVMRMFNQKLNQTDARHHQDMVDIVNHKVKPQAQSTLATPYNYFNTPSGTMGEAPDPAFSQHLEYNPYPDNIQQSVLPEIEPQRAHQQSASEPQHASTPNPDPVSPAADPAPEPTSSTSDNTVSPDIINLASNNDRTIESIAREANRIQEKQDLNKEVIIRLR